MSARIILITGANGGLGRAIGKAFLDESTDNLVWLGTHICREHADALAAPHQPRCHVLPLDVTRSDSWESGISTILATHGRIDVLVNNAGAHDDRLLGAMPLETWHSVLDTNLNGTFLGCRAVLPAMISQRGGRIINVASLSALLAPPGQTNYAAAKAGVVALTSSLAKEVARLGITVNAVCPGYVETEALSAIDEKGLQAIRQRIPMRRLGRPQEVAALIRFLACPDAGYLTGSAIKIDGGIY